jgi:hypothetical protein
MKSTPYVLLFLLCAGTSYGQGRPQRPSPKQAVTPKMYGLEGKDLPPFTRYDYVKSPRDPFLDKSVTVTIMGAYKPSVIDKLVLLSWLDNAGQTVIYVRNTETDQVRKVTSEPNKDNLRIVEIHPNADPKLFEAVISDGIQQGSVKFNLTPPKRNPQIETTSPTPAQTKSPQVETHISPLAPPKKN